MLGGKKHWMSASVWGGMWVGITLITKLPVNTESLNCEGDKRAVTHPQHWPTPSLYEKRHKEGPKEGHCWPSISKSHVQMTLAVVRDDDWVGQGRSRFLTFAECYSDNQCQSLVCAKLGFLKHHLSLKAA